MSITTKLQGGCGNQMFQYAIGLAAARSLNTDLQIDIGKYKHDGMREYNLCLFPRITETIVEDIPVTVGESGMPYNWRLWGSIEDGDVLNGYWQTEKYFRNVEDVIRHKFQAAPLTMEQEAWHHLIRYSRNPTFVTIRRTDYVGNTFHGELDKTYYEEALKIIVQKTGYPNIFVFTDDIPWCLNNLNFSWPFHIAGTYDRTVKGHIGREDADLYLMAACKNAVMANSSFSWWGAWLGDKRRREKGGVVVAPKQWFGPTSNEDSRDIVPDRWTKI